MLLSTACDGFVISRSGDGRTSESTIVIYKAYLKQLQTFLGDVEVSGIRFNDLERFMAHMRFAYVPHRPNGNAEPLSSSSLASVWSTLRSFFAWYCAEFGGDSPATRLKAPVVTKRDIHPFSEADVRALLRACTHTQQADSQRRKPFTMRRPTGLRDTAIIKLLLDTGLRIGELCRLKVGNVDLHTGEIFVAPYGTGRKTKSRHVYLAKSSVKSVWRYLASREATRPGDYLILSDVGERYNRNAARHLIVRLGQAAKVHNAHPHRFRHTFAIQYLRNGGDPFTLQRLLGHSTLDMVKVYLDIVRGDLQIRHAQASPVDRWNL